MTLRDMGVDDHFGGRMFRFEWPYIEDAENLVDRGHELLGCGEFGKANDCLMRALAVAPFLIDAHVGLGAIALETGAASVATAHYQAGLDLGLSVLPEGFTGLLSWYETSNRPFLRACHGLGLSLLHSGDRSSAERWFRFGLSLWPNDNIGLRFLLQHLQDGLDPLAMEELLDRHCILTSLTLPDVKQGLYGMHHSADAIVLTWEKQRKKHGVVMVQRFSEGTLEPWTPFSAGRALAQFRDWAEENGLEARYGLTSGKRYSRASVLVDMATLRVCLLDTEWWRMGGMAMLHHILQEIRGRNRKRGGRQ